MRAKIRRNAADGVFRGIWQATEAIFHDVLFVAELERTVMLTARCEGDTTLLAEVRSLLAAGEAEEVHRRGVGSDSVSP